MPKTKPISVDYYRELRSNYIGICLECGEEREMCEPDADGYHCESCGESAVQGAENLLFLDLVEFDD